MMSVLPSKEGVARYVDSDVRAFSVEIIAIGGNESVAGVVKQIEEAFVERQPGTEHGPQDDVLIETLHGAIGHRSLNFLFLVVQKTADLIGFDVANTANVLAETQTVALNFHITNF